MPSADAGVYRWVDDQGRVHFGDKPPDKERAESIDTTASPAPARPAPNAAERRDKQQRLLRAWEEERRQREEAQAKNKEEQERRENNCRIARDRLRSYRDAGYLYDLDAKGERRVFSYAERDAAIKEMEAAVAQWCG